MPNAYDTITTLLEGTGCEYRIHVHEPIVTVEDALSKVPHLTGNLLKTIVFKIKDGDWILAAVHHFDRIDYKKLARAFGVNRTKLRSIAPEQLNSELGFEIGGVGPFPVGEGVKVVFDEAARDLGQIFCGSGRNTHTVEIGMRDLLGLTRAAVAPITR